MNARDYRKKAREYLKGKWTIAILSALIYTVIILCISEISLKSNESSTALISMLVSILYWVIMPVLSRGLKEVYYRLRRGEEVKVFDFLKFGLRSFKRFWGLTWYTIIKLIWYLVAVIVVVIIFTFIFVPMLGQIYGTIVKLPFGFSTTGELSELGIGTMYMTGLSVMALMVIFVLALIKNFYYALTTYIGLDNPNLTTKEVVNKSEQIMKGNRGKYFCLILSFIGWYVLAMTVGGFLFKFIPNVFLVSNLLSVIGTIIISPYMNMSIIAFYENLVGTNK